MVPGMSSSRVLFLLGIAFTLGMIFSAVLDLKQLYLDLKPVGRYFPLSNGTGTDLVAPNWLRPRCDDVLGKMTTGHWQRRDVTPEEIMKMKTFLKQVRREKKMPAALDRPDKKCGNVSLPGVSGWIRALCDADGDTPCCYDNVCVNKSTEQCKCSNCVDLRQVIHAEHATWRPDDPSCQLQQMSVKEMCQLLGGVRLYFIGDSLVRHLYTAFLLALRGNEMTGALRDDTPKNVTAACTGLYMFTEKLCRMWVNTTATVCDGRVWLKLFYYYQVRHAKSIRGAVVQMNNSGRGIVLMGFGLHERLNSTVVQTRILAPLMKIPQLDVRRLVWLAIHCPGLMKAPHRGQGPDDVLSFNRNLTQFWSAYNVAIFDSFNMTDGVTSFDGTHYGLGVNRAKVQVLMHYFRSLAAQRLW